MSSRTPQRTIYLVTAALVAALIGGFALAATMTIPLAHPQGSTQGTTTPGALIAGYSWTYSELVVLVGTDVGLGTSTGSGNSLAGTQLALTPCAAATCSQNNAPAAGPTEVVGDYAEEIVLTVVQPNPGPPANGVEAQFVVTCTGCVTPTLVADAFLNAGGSTYAGGSAITVNLLIDTGISASSTTTVTISEVSIVMDNCVGLSNCP